MFVPNEQQQQSSSYPVRSWAGEPLPDQRDHFGAALQNYGLPTSAQGGLTPFHLSDETAQQHFADQQAFAPDLDMGETSILQAAPRQMPNQQLFEQYSYGQQSSYQHWHGQQLYGQHSLHQELSDQQWSGQQSFGQLSFGQQIATQQMPAEFTPVQPPFNRELYAQQMWRQGTLMGQMPFEEERVPPMFFPQQGQIIIPQFPLPVAPAESESFSILPPGFGRCNNCNDAFELSRNHGMACRRHTVGKSVVNESAPEWTYWDDTIGPKDGPHMRAYCPSAFIWPCCRRQGNAPGCASEAHVVKTNEDYITEAVTWAAGGLV